MEVDVKTMMAVGVILFLPVALPTLLVVLLVWKIVIPVVKLLIKHPLASVALGASLAFVLVLGPVRAALVVLLAALSALSWHHRHPETGRALREKTQVRRRQAWLTEAWPAAAISAGLGQITTEPAKVGRQRTINVRRYPGIERIDFAIHADTLVVRPLRNQHIGHFVAVADILGTTFGAFTCRARPMGNQHVAVELVHTDLLVDTVPLAANDIVDLTRVPIGLTDHGTVATVALEGNHLLIGGTTGAGKSSVVWSILHACAAQIHTGGVVVWAVDPKGGMELYPGLPLYTHYADGSLEEMVELLEQAATAMEARSQRYRAQGVRRHVSSREEPLHVIIADECADLTAKATGDLGKLTGRADRAIRELLRKGRAVGFVVIATASDPRAEAIPFRSLIPTAIALRLREKEQVRQILGDGMHELGAHCDRIPHPGAEGVGYLVSPDHAGPVRFRASWVSDQTITDLTELYPAPRPLRALDNRTA